MCDAFAGQQRRERLADRQVVGGGHHQDAPDEQRCEHLPDGGVEAGGGELEHAAARVEAELLTDGAEAADALVRDHHALGDAGGAGGVDQVRGVGRGCLPSGVRRGVRQRGQFAPDTGVVQQHVGDLGAGQPVGGRSLGQQRGRPGVGEHEGDTVRRIGRVDGQVGRAGLAHREQGGHQSRRTRQGDGHDVLGADALAHQQVCQAVGLGVQLCVGQLRTVVTDRHGGRGGGGLAAEQFGDGAPRHVARGRVEVVQHLVPLRRGEHIEPGDGQVRVRAHRVQQAQQPVGDARDGPRIEQVVAVLDEAGHAGPAGPVRRSARAG